MTATYDPTAQFDIDISEEIYRSGPDGDWPVRLYRPQGDGPFPVLLDVHGGASSNGSYLNNEDVDRALAASSILVAAIEFRQAPEHVYPAQVTDVKYGTRWLKARAADLGGDPSGDATVRYAIKGWPVLDSHARYLYACDAGVQQLMKSPKNYFGDEDTMREGNPQLVLERGEQTVLPPTLILQGTKDDNVPLAISERFVATYKSLGGSSERVLFSDMPHAFTREPGPETDRATQLMKSFIAEQLKDR